MRLPLQLGGLLLVALLGSAADQKAPKNPPPTKVAPERPAVKGRDGGVPKGAGKMGPRLTNPANPVSHLYRATPEQRDRALEKLPAAQQDRMRQNLQWFDSLPKEQQQAVLKRTEHFDNLTPERKRALEGQFQALGKLEQPRRAAVGAALRRLQTLTEDQRQQFLNSEQFRSRFSPEEQQMIKDLSEVMM